MSRVKGRSRRSPLAGSRYGDRHAELSSDCIARGLIQSGRFGPTGRKPTMVWAHRRDRCVMAFRTQRKAGMPAGIVNLIDLSGTEPNPVFSAPWSSIRFDPPPTDIYPRDRLIQFRKAAYRRSKILRARKKPNP